MVSVRGRKISLRGVYLSSVAGLIIKKLKKYINKRKRRERNRF